MIHLFNNSLVDYSYDDLLISLIQQCDIDTLENLYQCNTFIKNQLNSGAIINILLKRFEMHKPEINSFNKFIIEYNHRFRRHLSYEDDPDNHLLWAIRDQDIKTVKSVISEYTYGRDRSADWKFYEMFFEAGCQNNIMILSLLTENSFVNETISNVATFYSGMAYSHISIDQLVLEKFNDEELSAISLQAARGNNTKLMNALENLIHNESLKHRAVILGAVAGDNLKLLTSSKVFKWLMLHDEWKIVELPFFDNGDFLGWFDSNESTIIDQLIVYGLYYKSKEVLDFLSDGYQLSECFNTIHCSSDHSGFSYYWINDRLPFSDDMNYDICWNAACYDNLFLVKGLKRYIDPDKPSPYFVDAVENNAYKVIIWLLQTYKYNPKDIRAMFDDNDWIEHNNLNYAEKVVISYILEAKSNVTIHFSCGDSGSFSQVIEKYNINYTFGDILTIMYNVLIDKGYGAEQILCHIPEIWMQTNYTGIGHVDSKIVNYIGITRVGEKMDFYLSFPENVGKLVDWLTMLSESKTVNSWQTSINELLNKLAKSNLIQALYL